MSIITAAQMAKVKPNHPTSRKMKPLENIKVRLLRDSATKEECEEYDIDAVPTGTIVIAMLMPHGCIYLSCEGCFETDAIEGIDFEFI